MCGIEYCFSQRAAEEAIIFLCLACFHGDRTFSVYGDIFSFSLSLPPFLFFFLSCSFYNQCFFGVLSFYWLVFRCISRADYAILRITFSISDTSSIICIYSQYMLLFFIVYPLVYMLLTFCTFCKWYLVMYYTMLRYIKWIYKS